MRLLYRVPIPGLEDIAFNFVFPVGQATATNLRAVNFQGISKRCVAALEAAGISHGLLAFDISFNDDTDKFRRGRFKKPPAEYWQVHIYGIVRTQQPERLLNVLRNLYRRDEKIFAPVKRKKKFDGSNRAISYLLKPEAWRRVSFWATKLKKPDWRTRGVSLKAKEQVEYLLAAHHLGFPGRVMLINLHPIKVRTLKKLQRTVALRIATPRRTTM